MRRYSEKIRECAGRLLAEGVVEGFIGYRKGTVPMMHEPVLVRDAGGVEELYWDSFCSLNLCNYLTKRTDKVGVVVTGCSSRNVVTHLVENQVARERVYLVGVPCEGMIDHRAVARLWEGREIEAVEDEGEYFVVKGGGAEERYEKGKYLQSNCAVCRHRNPVLYDELLGEPVEEQAEVEVYGDVARIEGMDSEEKWGFFTRMISGCIRCYACRNACPLCYCPTCFVDESNPQWVGKSSDGTDTMTFHVLRAYHCAGRCTDCGACERVCPVGIPVRQFTKKLNKDCEELFTWEAGLEVEARPPLDVYRPDDYNEFIR